MKALGLVPLGFYYRGLWSPEEKYWGEEDEPFEEWARQIIVRGPRSEYEMEQVLSGQGFDDPLDNPIIRSNYLKDADEEEESVRILMELRRTDLRCLDAHSYLGNHVLMSWQITAPRQSKAGRSVLTERSFDLEKCGHCPHFS